MAMNLVFLGAPGSGKGTQAGKLSALKGLKHLSTGDLLRAEVAKKTELGLTVQKVIEDGKLVTDELVVKILKANVDLVNFSYIFDGFPRNIAQAQILDEQLLKASHSKAIYFEIPLDVLVARLSNRRTCSKCGEIYNLLTKKPKVDGICDVCGSNDLAHRKDDKPEVIENRLKVFKDTIDPVLDYYKSKGRLVVLNAQKQESEIFDSLCSLI